MIIIGLPRNGGEIAESNDGKTLAIINLLPLLVLAIFFYKMSWPQTFYRIGFAGGTVPAVILLSILFARIGYLIGLLLNCILLGFLFLSYYLPYTSESPSFIIVFITGLLIILYLLAPFLSITFLKGRQAIDLPILLPYLCIAFLIIFYSIKYIYPFSLKFVFCQVLGWTVMVIGLYLSEPRRKMVLNFLKDRLIAKGLKSNLRKKTVLAMFILFLLISTLFEAFRGLWLFWALTICWLSLMFAFFWKFWRYAFKD